MSSNKADNGDNKPTSTTIRNKTQEYSSKFKEYLTTHLSPHALYDAQTENYQQNESNNQSSTRPDLHQKYEQLRQRLIQMEQTNQQLMIENNKLKTVVRALTQFVKTGSKPAYDSVQMMKKQNCEWSKRINKLKQQIYLKQLRNNINKTKEDKSTSITITHTDEQKIDNEYISDDILQQNISEYMETNSLNNNDPLIIIKDTKNDICLTNKIDASDLLQSFVVQKPHRISALVGGIGVRTKKFISKGTVLGQFTGTEYLSEEYKEIYGESNEYDTRNMYVYETNVCIGNVNNNNIKKVKMVIDGWDNKNCNQLIYINDCRKDMNIDIPTKDDEIYWNCCFKNVFIDSWPCVFVIARRDIKIGEELNLFYGDNYGKWSKSNDNVFMARVGGLIDDVVLKMLGMENAVSDVYLFDTAL